MPSKVVAEREAEIESDEEEMMPMGPGGYPGEIPERKEYLWSCNLKGEKDTFKFEGGDSETESIIFKSAALGLGAKGRHTVEVSAVNASSEKVTAILCILTDQNCWIRLPDLSIEPPLLLTLVEGSGPVNICANHMLEEDPEIDEDEDEEMESEENMETVVEPEKEAPAGPKKEQKAKKEVEDQKKRKADEDVKESPAKKSKPEKKEKKNNRNYESVDDVKKAIVANPGGKPKVKPKFSNWVKNTMKCQNEEWIEQLWDWHKAENKL
jgi:hypothetical protein